MSYVSDVEKKFTLFNKCKKKLRTEANPIARKKLIDTLYMIKLYGDLIIDKEDLSESEREMLEQINKRSIPTC